MKLQKKIINKKMFVFLIVLCVYVYIFYKIFEQIHQVDFALNNLSFRLFVSLFLIELAFLLNAVMYVKILKGLGSEPESSLKIILLNFMMQPIKYIPLGSVLNAFTQGTVFGKLKGISKISGLLSPFIGLYITIISGSVLFWILDFWTLKFGIVIHWLIGVFNLVGILLLLPKFIRFLFIIIQKISRNRILFGNIDSRKLGKYLFQSFMISFVFWIILGIGTYYAIQSTINIKQLSLLTFVSSYSFSAVIGYLLIIFPSGLGVREGALIFLFHSLTSPYPYLIALICRVSWIVAELINFIIALVIGKSLLKGIANEFIR